MSAAMEESTERRPIQAWSEAAEAPEVGICPRGHEAVMLAVDAAGRWEPATGERRVTCGECGLLLTASSSPATVRS